MKISRGGKMFILFLLVCVAIPVGWVALYSPRVFLKDYPALYKDELQALFGDDFSVGERVSISKYEEHVDRSATFVYYYSWEITYKDQFGEEFSVELINREGDFYAFERQVFRWMRSQVLDHFTRELLRGFDLTGDDANSHVTILDDFFPDDKAAERNQLEIFRTKIIHSLREINNLPHLYDFDYSKWFELYPSYFEIGIHSNALRSRAVSEREVANSVFEECEGAFNVILCVEDESGSKKEYYLMGVAGAFDSEKNYMVALYDEYEKRGLFD